jgi:hypothetical protein
MSPPHQAQTGKTAGQQQQQAQRMQGANSGASALGKSTSKLIEMHSFVTSSSYENSANMPLIYHHCKSVSGRREPSAPPHWWNPTKTASYAEPTEARIKNRLASPRTIPANLYSFAPNLDFGPCTDRADRCGRCLFAIRCALQSDEDPCHSSIRLPPAQPDRCRHLDLCLRGLLRFCLRGLLRSR